MMLMKIMQDKKEIINKSYGNVEDARNAMITHSLDSLLPNYRVPVPLFYHCQTPE
jgi:hypothetical protein